MSFDELLPPTFAGLMGASLRLYVVSDGYDLGVRILMHRPTAEERDTMVAFILSFLGLSYGIYPFVVIDRLIAGRAASSPASLGVILIGVCVTLPVIVACTGFSYRVFRGKPIELDDE